MSGAVLAAASGVGFGVFQSINVRALREGEDPYASTFVQVVVAALLLAVIALATGDVAGVFDAPLWALGYFTLSGILHFLAGWSLLNLSQQRIGAARTSPLLTTAPVFGAFVAFVTIGQLPSGIALVAMGLMCAGAYVVASRGGIATVAPADAVAGLGCALMWSISPIFIARGLEGYDSPLAGLVVGLAITVLAYAALYAIWRGRSQARRTIVSSITNLKLLAGALVGLSTWWRWAALDDATVGAVLALNLLSVPIVLLLAPILAGRAKERVTAGLWAGAGLVVAGALLLVTT
ncbi:EamA family transporter [Conexibacter sp. CPCC 206217]|uniref:EamA family transporter n=1 Tax=Conexibacter sp. CPCC 206217 TaxID=3064574 RepID=UPI002726B8F9|nr:EamA family transporter [Conexibacter sp. CPCC 206217]MDO8212490.1 EamA family transporter [Conexibacter sp. CPCC 206217]